MACRHQLVLQLPTNQAGGTMPSELSYNGGSAMQAIMMPTWHWGLHGYGINSILYQRGVYPQDTFKSVQHYGIPLLVSTDEKVNKYLATVLGQVESWVAENKAERLVLVLKDIDTNEVIERWEFRVENEKTVEANSSTAGPVGKKELKKIQAEIRDVMRQVTASVSFLPLLECVCCFEVLVYTRTQDSEQPEEWLESEPLLIPNSETVNLRSFSTSLHKVEALVSYKISD